MAGTAVHHMGSLCSEPRTALASRSYWQLKVVKVMFNPGQERWLSVQMLLHQDEGLSSIPSTCAREPGTEACC